MSGGGAPRRRVEEVTARWIRERLGAPPLRLLEVGCGSGELAALLLEDGFHVEGIDPDPGAVEDARLRGVDARLGEWPGLDVGSHAGGGYDAILFRRSLHHLEDPGGAVRQAVRLLTPGGVILVEEFDRFGLTAPAGAWIAGQARVLEAAELLRPPPDSMVRAWGEGEDPVAAWRDRFDLELPGLDTLRSALSGPLEVDEEEVPLLWRELARSLPDSRRGVRILDAVREAERAQILAGSIPALGRRFIGRPRAGAGAGGAEGTPGAVGP